MSLFVPGRVKLASGAASWWKLEANVLTAQDWGVLAALAVERLPSFRAVEGVPTGGLPFAEALQKFVTPTGELDLLVADDVWTTGGSIRQYLWDRAGGEWCPPARLGIVVAFNRSGGPAKHYALPGALALWSLA